MSTIQVDDITFRKLQANASCMGVSLEEYLRMVADAARPHDEQAGPNLADAMEPIIQQARNVATEQPIRRQDPSETLIEQEVVEKFRKQGLKL